MKAIWKDRDDDGGSFTQKENGVCLSYQPYNKCSVFYGAETAIILDEPTKIGGKRFLIYRGDWREQLSEIFPDIEKLKQHYRKYGGHPWSDGLDE